MTDTETIKEIVRRLVAAVDPEQIVLFGSRATGQSNDNSDVDLLIIEREPFGLQRSRLEEITRLEMELGRLPLSTDLLVYSLDELSRWRNSKRHVIGRALREGQVLYVRH